MDTHHDQDLMEDPEMGVDYVPIIITRNDCVNALNIGYTKPNATTVLMTELKHTQKSDIAPMKDLLTAAGFTTLEGPSPGPGFALLLQIRTLPMAHTRTVARALPPYGTDTRNMVGNISLSLLSFIHPTERRIP